MSKQIFWVTLVAALVLSTPVALLNLGVDKTLAQSSFMFWFIMPGIVVALTRKNPLLATQQPRRHDRYAA